MDAARRRDLENSLRARLDAQLAAGPLARLIWLGEQVENYVERWAAFSELSHDRAGGDLLVVVEIGAALVSEELARLPAVSPGLHEAWWRFLGTLAHIRDGGETVSAALLRSAFADAKGRFAAANPSSSVQECSDGHSC